VSHLLHFVVYKSELSNRGTFVEFWSARYGYEPELENFYTNNIGQHDPCAIMKLFLWKNGGFLSRRKAESVKQNYLDRLCEFGSFDAGIRAEDFLRNFGGGAIWRIFFFHCFRQDFPIYDQHVHRAMTYIQGENFKELAECSDAMKVKLYLKHYLPFHQTFAGLDPRLVDKALWTFGKFIKSWRV